MIQTGVHKKNELDYFFVEESYGGNQDLFPEVSMRDGGCGAVAACESCIYFAEERIRRNFIRINSKRSHGKSTMILHIS